MTTIRLSHEMEEQLKTVVETEHRSKSDIIKQALSEFLDKCCTHRSAFELGVEFFGKHGSGHKNLSRDYKRLLKARLHAKHAH